jgi:hypothetical protein
MREYKARIDWGAGCGCLIVLVNIAITIGIFYAAAHFILKFW